MSKTNSHQMPLNDLMQNRRDLTRFAWLSIGAAVITIVLKGGAYFLTGSVGLFSDAIEFESIVRKVLGGPVTVFTHPEPVEDEISMQDVFLDRN